MGYKNGKLGKNGLSRYYRKLMSKFNVKKLRAVCEIVHG